MTSEPNKSNATVELFDLLSVLWRHKILISLATFLLTAIVAAISLVLPPVYRAETEVRVVVPDEELSKGLLGGFQDVLSNGILGRTGTEQENRFRHFLESRDLGLRFIKAQNLLPVLFASKWDEQSKDWSTDEPPTLLDGFHEFRTDIIEVGVERRTGYITLGMRSRSPEKARQLVVDYLVMANRLLREEALRHAERKISHLQEQLAKSDDAELREAVVLLIQQAMRDRMFATVNSEFAFETLDPPITPEKRAWPKRVRMTLIALIASAALISFAVLIYEFEIRPRRGGAGNQSGLKT